MQISQDEVAHIAWLARLGLSESELALYTEQLSTILAHFETLQQLDVAAVEPMVMATTRRENVVRADVPVAGLTQDEVLANAADTEDGYFKVRAILEENV